MGLCYLQRAHQRLREAKKRSGPLALAEREETPQREARFPGVPLVIQPPHTLGARGCGSCVPLVEEYADVRAQSVQESVTEALAGYLRCCGVGLAWTQARICSH